MVLTDTHTHLYLEEFKEDIDLVIQKAISNNVSRFFLPAINSKHNQSMLGLRKKYPDWKYLIDGDGGDENLKDYPIEENPELTIRSVVNNQMLYQEGWGVGTIKHSLTYSGGLSRSCLLYTSPSPRD